MRPDNPLYEIMLETEDLGLFGDEVVSTYLDGPTGPARARTLFAHEVFYADPELSARRQRYLELDWLWSNPATGNRPDRTVLGTGLRFGKPVSPGPDAGSTVANRWLTVFGVPVFPLGTWWVTTDPNRRTLGRARSKPGVWLAPALLVYGALQVAVVPLTLSGALDFPVTPPSGRLDVVNGYSETIRVRIGDAEQSIAPGRHTYFRTAAPGPAEVTSILEQSGPIETTTIDIGPSNDDGLTLYNPGGMAVLHQSWAVYDFHQRAPAPRLLVGRTFELERPDDLFEPSPELVFAREDSQLVRSSLQQVLPHASPEARLTLLARRSDLDGVSRYSAFVDEEAR